MPNEKMSEPKSVGPISVLGLCSPLLLLAELEAEGKEKKARLRAQQRGRVAPRKKGRFRAALRHLWGKSKGSRPQTGQQMQGHNHRFVGEHTGSGSYYSCPVCGATPSWEPERKRKFSGAVPKMSPEEKAR